MHLGRLLGESGFSRTVAIKQLHPQLVDAPEIAAGLLDEARIVSRIQHPNVVPTIDLLSSDDEVLLVMEYVHGESLSRLLAATRARREKVPTGIVASVLCGALHGLHAAHEARSEAGEPLGIVHRDVSPENLLVGVDGATRLLDFGIAKAHGRLTTTRNGQLKGKIAYMAPEQLLCGEVTRRTDVYAAGIVLWESLTGVRLFTGADEAAVMTAAFEAPIPLPSTVAPHLPQELDAIVLRALDRRSEGRYATARELAIAVEEALPLAPPREVGAWVERLAGPALAKRALRISRMEIASAAAATAPQIPHHDEGEPTARVAASDDTTRTDFHGARPRPPATEPANEVVAILTPERNATWNRRGAAALAFLLLGAGFAWWQGTPRRSLAAAGGPSSMPVGASAPVEASVPVRASVPVASPPPPMTNGAPGETSPAGRGPAPVSAPPPPSSIAVPAPRPRASAPPASSSCNPPYNVDTNGVRHLRPECI